VKPRNKYILQTALLAAVYLVFARLGLSIQPVNAFATLVWPPSGIALAALLVFGYRYWPGIAVGAILANLWTGAPVPVALGIGAGNTLEALAGAYALRSIPGFRGSLDRLQDVLGLIVFGCVASTAVSATIGVSSLVLGGIVPAARFGATWRAWWLGDAIGDLVVVPLLLTLRRSPDSRARLPRLLEASVLAILIALSSLFLFDLSRDGKAALLSPLLVWAAIRFEQRGAARAVFLVSAIAVWATALGLGPFARTPVSEGLVLLQAYMALTASTFLVLGTVTSERRRAEEQRKRAEEVVRESEERYRTLAEAVDQSMWINDAEGRTIYVNPKVEEMFGSLDLSQAAPAVEIMHPDDRAAAAELRRRALETGEPYRAEYRVLRRDGQYRWMLARVVPVKEASGRITSWIGAATDVTDMKTAEQQLRRAKEEAEAANHAKDHFLAALSHELRTPLTPVLAVSSALEQNAQLPADTRRKLEIVRRNAELEARLIDDLLDLTRIARGKITLQPERVELSQALGDVVEICRGEALEKGLVLDCDGVGHGKFVGADPARVRQIFWNILKNAIKFTPRGGSIRFREASPAPGRIAIEIADTGVGIEPSQIARIFRPFEQAGERSGGLGLGLAISSALVEAHGGSLTASSEGPGLGATFRVELDLAGGRSEPAAAPAAGEMVRSDEIRHVLLVEDHADTLDAARELLTELSCQVVTATSVREALEAARTAPFDLVISDLGLPDGSGVDLMRILRRRHGLSGIAVSGYGMEEDLRRSLEAGFVDHLVKPITFQRLERAISRFFAARQRSSETQAGQASA
jgi:PAS domain S-box-containing protein